MEFHCEMCYHQIRRKVCYSAAAYGRKGDTMGTYLNPGKQNFQMAVNSEIFVDKSRMIRYLNTIINTNQRFVSVSRPRRFGKTMAADMVCAYYDREADSRDMFQSLKIAGCLPEEEEEREESGPSWDAYLGRFDVIRIVMTKFFKKNVTVENALATMQRFIIRDFKKTYPDADYFDEGDLLQTIEDVYSENGRQLVIVIDEWDALFRVRREDKEGQTEYLDFLRDLLKDNNHIALAYMTGILPIKKYGQHSALNMFDEYSMIQPMQLAAYTGFTEDEVGDLCRRYGRDYQKIKDWYDGYELRDVLPPDPDHKMYYEMGHVPPANRYALYSPLSVVNAIRTGHIRNYWNKTETYEALAEYIRRDYDGLKEAVALLMDGGRLWIDTSTYQNDMTTFAGRDDILSLLIHLGYLGYEEESSRVFIPNREILDEFRTSTKSKEWIDTMKSFEISRDLLKATWAGDADKVAELIEKAHNRAGNKTYHDESALSYAVRYAYYAAEKYYTTIVELDSGKGYADIVYLPAPGYPDKPVLLIELKYEKTAMGAISQIKRQGYPERLEHYKGNILMVGINYNREIRSGSPEYKHHSCRIERA